MHLRSLCAGAFGLVVAPLTIAACGIRPPAATPSRPATTPPMATTSVPARPSTPSPATPLTPRISSATTTAPVTSATPTSTTAEPVACSGPQLAIGLGQGSGGGLGHQQVVFTFRNISSRTCTLTGYPGVNGLIPTGQNLPAARSLNGYLGGVSSSTPPVLDLAPGDTASAMAEDTDVAIYPAASCATFNAFLVTPPNTIDTQRIVAGLPACSRLVIHPVVSGTTGSENP